MIGQLSGASVSGDQAPVWLCQNPLPWTQEEHRTVGHLVCPVQFVDGADEVARGAGMSASGGKASGAAHGQRSLKGLKNRCPTARIELKTQDIEVDCHLPWLALN